MAYYYYPLVHNNINYYCFCGSEAFKCFTAGIRVPQSFFLLFFSVLQLVMEFCGAGSITDLVKGMCYFLP